MVVEAGGDKAKVERCLQDTLHEQCYSCIMGEGKDQADICYREAGKG